MQYLITAFLILMSGILPVKAQSIFDLFIQQNNQKAVSIGDKKLSFFVDGNYYDCFHISNSSGAKQYLYQKNQSYHAHYYSNNYEYSAYARLPDDKFYVNNIKDIDDHFSVNYNYPEYEINVKKRSSKYQIDLGLLYSLKLGGKIKATIPIKGYNLGLASSYKLIKYRLDYNIQGRGGEIPFPYFFNKNTISFSNSKFSFNTTYSPIIPTTETGNFSSRIYGYNFTNRLTYKFKIINNIIEYSYNNIAASLKYKGDEYSYIDNLHHNYYLISSRINLNEKYKLSLGITGIKTWINTGSYLDIWPFTHWDIFLQSRTRLKKFDNRLHLPFTSLNYSYTLDKVKIKSKTSFDLGYYHIFFTTDSIYKERYTILYPIYFGYKTKLLDMSTDINGILKLKIDSSWFYKNYKLTVFLNQLIPIDFSELNFRKKSKPDEEGVYESRRGGTNLWISLGYFIN